MEKGSGPLPGFIPYMEEMFTQVYTSWDVPGRKKFYTSLEKVGMPLANFVVLLHTKAPGLHMEEISKVGWGKWEMDREDAVRIMTAMGDGVPMNSRVAACHLAPCIFAYIDHCRLLCDANGIDMPSGVGYPGKRSTIWQRRDRETAQMWLVLFRYANGCDKTSDMYALAKRAKLMMMDKLRRHPVSKAAMRKRKAEADEWEERLEDWARESAKRAKHGGEEAMRVGEEESVGEAESVGEEESGGEAESVGEEESVGE